jgi:hypothetical protein
MEKLLIFDAGHTLNNNFDFIINEIKEKKPKEVLFWCIMEYETPNNIIYSEYDRLNDVCVSENVDFYFIFSTKDKNFHKKDSRYQYSNFTILYWPTYLLHHTLDTMCNFDINEYKVVNEFDKLYLNFNYKIHTHRCIMLDALCENGLLEHGKISWNLLRNTNHHSMVNYEFRCWEEKIMKVDKYDNHEITEDLLETKTFMSLTSESNTNCLFVSEKTFRSLLIEQIFYCIGAKNQKLVLKEFGFVLYDELFDYSYDKSDYLKDRIDGVIVNLKNNLNKDYYSLHNLVKDKIEFNKKRALEIINKDPFIPQKFVQMYKENKETFINYRGIRQSMIKLFDKY